MVHTEYPKDFDVLMGLYQAKNIGQDIFEDKVQEYYSLRCVSQVLGPVSDTIENAERIIVDELNSGAKLLFSTERIRV